MLRTSALVLAVGLALAGLAQAATNSDDVIALQSLQACVANSSANLAFLNGWNTSSGSTPSAPGADATTAALAAAGVPGVTAGQTPSAPGTDSSDPCATVPWTGLLCTGDRVTTITMAQLGPNSLYGCDVGNLTDLSGLSEVKEINMQAVGLAGSLPGGWASGFEALEMLTLSQNNIEGTLPSEWLEGFPALNTLDAHQNGIEGTLPPGWGSGTAFPELLNLVLGNNSLTGVLPLWTGFPKAQLFGLSSNNLGGVLPERWAFPALSQLQLEDNDFEGCLPGSWVQNLPNLTRLNVADNGMIGALPTSYADADNLTVLTITPGNNFCGTISSDLASTPDGKGNRFDPQPADKNGDGGYDLDACDADLVCPAYAGTPAPAPDAPAISSAGRKMLQA